MQVKLYRGKLLFQDLVVEINNAEIINMANLRI